MALKQLAKRVLSTRWLPKLYGGKRFIFVYHDIAEKNENRYSPYYSVTPDNFKHHLQLFKETFKLVDLDTLVSNESLGKQNYASIVFDDGFQSVKDIALPILEKAGVPTALFVNRSAIQHNQLWVTNLELMKDNTPYLEQVWKWLHNTDDVTFEEFKADPVGISIRKGSFKKDCSLLYTDQLSGKRIYLDEDGIRQVAERGVLIGSHTSDHIVMSRTDDLELNKQVDENKTFIESLTGQSSEHFAIPFGKKEHYNEKSISVIRSVGHKYIYSTNPNCFTYAGGNVEMDLIPRIGVADITVSTLSFYINRALLKKYDI